MMSILVAVLCKFRAEFRDKVTLVFLLGCAHEVHFSAFLIVFFESLLGFFHVLLALLFGLVGCSCDLLGLELHVNYGVVEVDFWLRFRGRLLVAHQYRNYKQL